jgi:hypothetical protein
LELLDDPRRQASARRRRDYASPRQPTRIWERRCRHQRLAAKAGGRDFAANCLTVERHPSAGRPCEDVMRRLYALPCRDQVEVYLTLGEYLGSGVTAQLKVAKQLQERGEASKLLKRWQGICV